jgi:hypothetical protein
MTGSEAPFAGSTRSRLPRQEIATFLKPGQRRFGAMHGGQDDGCSATGQISMRVIQRRSDEIVHSGIDDDERLGLPVLHEQHTRHQDAGISNKQATGLKDQAAIQIARGAFDHLGVGLRTWRRLVVIAVGNA